MKLFSIFTLFLCFLSPTHALERTARIQALSDRPSKTIQDIYDASIQSPKSAAFSVDGKRLYINALEGMQTLVYSYPELKKIAAISHQFSAADAPLFQGETTVFDYPYTGGKSHSYNVFSGKPVEMAFSHAGRFLWIPYYRRSFDQNASSPSALAIIDTSTHKIVRVMPTGPLPKYIAISPDSSRAVVTHWGDNTLGLLDISSSDPKQFVYLAHWTVDYKVSTAHMTGDRDRNCSLCLRGTTFTPDGKTVLVARMGGNGIAGFDVSSGTYLGTIQNVVGNPRHLLVDSNYLYVSGNQTGLVGRYPLHSFLQSLYLAKGKKVLGPNGEEILVGSGARTIVLSPLTQALYVAVNSASSLVKIDLASWSIVKRISVDPFAVGLAVHPQEPVIVTTSQGRSGQGGGHSVNLFLDTSVGLR